MLKSLLLALGLLSIVACQTPHIVSGGEHKKIAEIPLLDHEFDAKPKLPSVAEQHQLSVAEQEKFLAYFNHESRQDVSSHRRVYNYLDFITTNFEYDEGTFVASESVQTGRGNCLSLAILTTSLAQIVGVEVEYQLVELDPVFTLAANSLVKGVHIRTRLVKPTKNDGYEPVILRRGGIIVDYFPSGKERFVGNVSFGDYTSRYYLNMATDALEKNDLSLAYWHVVAALEANPASSDALNSLAVIYRRSGFLNEAEKTYVYAIANTKNKLSLLKNYQQMLLAENRLREANEIQSRLDTLDDPSPHRWYLAGMDALQNGDHRDAIKFLKKAETLAPTTHQIHFALARAYDALGKKRHVQSHLGMAMDLSVKPTNRKLYQSKLKAISET